MGEFDVLVMEKLKSKKGKKKKKKLEGGGGGGGGTDLWFLRAIKSTQWTGRSGAQVPAWEKDPSLFPNVQTGCRGPSCLVPNIYSNSLLGIKRRGHEIYHPSPPSEKIKNKWSYTSTPPICLCGVGKDSFTFTSNRYKMQLSTERFVSIKKYILRHGKM